MDTKVIFLLLGSALCAFMLAAQGEDDSPQLLPYSDVLKLFTDLASPYRDLKAARNLQMDLQVDNIVFQINSIIPALETLHQLVHNISIHVPLLTSNINEPLLDVKNNLNQVLGHVSKCHQTSNMKYRDPDIKRHTPHIDEYSETASSSEEIQEHHQPSLESVEDDQHSDNIAFMPHFLELLAPMTTEDSRLDTVLATYATNSVISLNDTAKAFKEIADKFTQGHGRRFLNLLSKIREVDEKFSNIRQHVAMATTEMKDMTTKSVMFYSSSVGCVEQLTKLTSAVRELTDHIC